ncbi:MAG: hypothetical protein DMG11_17810 [Acidobacteria bacterium]|nr:MAG: hypothetical protein DMG11_17810 [Acidobacteriota bacterium]
MFCRYCGAYLPDDSIFCAKCGKRLGRRENPRLAKIAQTLHLKTPYPYFALLVFFFIVWTINGASSWIRRMRSATKISTSRLYRWWLKIWAPPPCRVFVWISLPESSHKSRPMCLPAFKGSDCTCCSEALSFL